MPEKQQIRSIKGVRDILPPASVVWNGVEQAARQVFGNYGFGEIRLPLIEESRLFARSVGEDTDIVGKEMYTFTDRDQTSISLRPEATASVCRAYIEHGMHTWPQPVKLYYMGPMFRRERPQKGRYRQFYQIGAEVLGQSEAPEIDAELIEMLLAFFGKIGLTGTKLYVNSIGCKDCRPKYVELLREELRKVRDKLGADSQRRIETNPLRVLDSKTPEEQPIIEALPRISDHLCPACREHFAELKEQLAMRGIVYEQSWRLVRGLDYYTRTTFEIIGSGLGSQDALCGGGRYDGLVELLGGPPTKGIGFAIGTDRLMLALEASTLNDDIPSISLAMQRPDLAVVATTEHTWGEAIRLAGSLREKGLSVFLPKSGTKLARALEMAGRLGIRAAILVGEGEGEGQRNEYGIRILSPLESDLPRDAVVGQKEVFLYGRLVRLRQALERALTRLATGREGLERQHNISVLIEHLTQRNLLPPRYVEAIKDVSHGLNRAIHGKPLADAEADGVLAYGMLLVDNLERLSSAKD
jgi:histidyl-tRNA synthetase